MKILLTKTARRGTLLGLVLSSALAARAGAAPGPLHTQQVARFLAVATGTFPASSPSYGTDTYPAGVALADFNADGRPDVVTPNTAANTVSVLLNTGTGTFPASGTTYTTGGSPVAVAVGDFNLDGHPDIVTANVANDPSLKTGTITVLLNSGSGTFTVGGSYGSGTSSFNTTGTTAPVTTSTPVAVAVGLLSADTYPDIVVTNADGAKVGVFINTGSGTFPSAATLYTVGSYPTGVTIGDFNADNHPDLAVANSLGNTVSVLLNTGTGTFGTQVAYTVGSQPTAVAVGLLNADAYPDLAVINTSASTVSVLTGTASGTFGTQTTYATGSSPGAIIAADLDVDGDVDLATANGNAATVSVLLNAGTGTFGAKADYATGSGPSGLAVGFVDTNTAPDLAVSNSLGNSVSILLGALAMPTLTSISPNSGTAGSTSVTLTGTNFNGATSVNFTGATASTGFTVNAAGTTLTLTVPTGTTTGSVTVTTPGGTSNAVTFTINTVATATTTTLTSSLNPSTFAQNVTFTAMVNNAAATGIVTFFDNGASIGTGTLSNGVATLNTLTLMVGSHPITATYGGSSSYAASTSTTLTQVVNAATVTTTTTLASSANPATFGQSITLTATVSNAAATGTVTFYDNGTSIGTGTLSSGVATLAISTLTAGSHPLTATYAGSGIYTASTSATLPQVVDAATATAWNGSVNTDWFTAANWNNGVPTASLDASIPAALPRYPALANGSATAKSLTIVSGASLTQSGGALALSGALANSGSISATGGTLTLNGTTAQSIGGSGSTQVWNLTVSNAAGATQVGPLSFHGVLALTGSLTTNGQPLTLLSDASGTGLVDNAGGGSVSGTATVQRYIDPALNAGVGYRHYSSPVASTTLADLNTSGFTPIFNTAYNSSAMPNLVTPFPTVYAYEEARVLTSPATTYSSFDKGWFSPIATDNMERTRGYTVNIAASQTVDFVGTLNTGTISQPLNRNGGTDGGWHLLGNPYPSPLNWSQVTIPAGLESALYVYESTSQYGGSYRSYTNGVGNPVVALGQGFFVRATGSTTLSFTNAARLTTATATAFHRTAAENRPLLQLTLRGTATPALADEAYVYFESGATAGVDAQYDARKIQHNNGGAPSLFALAAGTELSINGLPQLASSTVVPLGIDVPAAGTFTLEAAQLLNLASATVYLHDALTNQTINLSQQPSYTFQAAAAGMPSSRFELRFEPARPTATVAALAAASVSLYPNPATGSFTLLVPAATGATKVQATLLNSLGQQVRQQEAALPAAGTQLRFDATHLATGIYLVRVQAGNVTVTKRLTIQ